MKRFLLILVCIIGTFYAHGQIIIEFTKAKNESKPIAKVQILGGGLKGDSSWISNFENNLNASLVIGKAAKKGKYTVVIKYMVAKDGTILDVVCENDPGYEMGNVAVRILKKSVKWKFAPLIIPR